MKKLKSIIEIIFVIIIFSNLIFSQPQTKVLTLVNLQRGFEPYIAYFVNSFKLDFLAVTGEDVDPSDSQSSFSVPLEKVKEAFEYLAKGENSGKQIV